MRMLVIGLFAMFLHVLAGSGLVRAGVAGAEGFVPDVCSSHGSIKPGTGGNLPQGKHDCCKLCAAGAPPMLPTTAIAAGPVRALVGPIAQTESATPGSMPAAAHRPRGPPGVA